MEVVVRADWALFQVRRQLRTNIWAEGIPQGRAGGDSPGNTQRERDPWQSKGVAGVFNPQLGELCGPLELLEDRGDEW
jgi:hypothetical protein